MIIAVASGKGGTGKTTVAVNLALALSDQPVFPDCDVEEPNAALFLRPTITQREEVGILIPEVDFDKCTTCGRCAEVCAYHAITVMAGRPLLFSHLCHSCGGCALACPAEAIKEEKRVIGRIDIGTAGRIRFVAGELHVGEAMPTPVIRQVKSRAGGCPQVIIDAPPGA